MFPGSGQIADSAIVQLLRKSFLRRPLRALAHWYILKRWDVKGRPFPPPALFKQKLVREYGRQCTLQTLVETGTAKGKMIQACLQDFQEIISIEFDLKLHLRALGLFRAYPHVVLLLGDSGEVLADVLETLSEPALFWLDAHAMIGGAPPPKVTPIWEELEQILNHTISGHGILIDDARLFEEKYGYPSIEMIHSLIKERLPGYSFAVEDDVIRICPR
jgi:hypothetical protein